MNRQKNLSVRFTDDTKAELKKLHESHEIKPAALVRIAVDRFLASYEKDGPQAVGLPAPLRKKAKGATIQKTDEAYAARPETAQPTKAKRVASP